MATIAGVAGPCRQLTGCARVRGTVGVGVRVRLRIRLRVRIRVRVRIRAKVRARARVRVRVRDHHVRPEGLQDRGAERVSISTTRVY